MHTVLTRTVTLLCLATLLELLSAKILLELRTVIIDQGL
jgi:hypothetical protein